MHDAFAIYFGKSVVEILAQSDLFRNLHLFLAGMKCVSNLQHSVQ
jgi:hypothetical protein